MFLRLQDSLSGRSRTVRRRPGRPIHLYVCGPTVYDTAHVGHARTYLYFDVLRRNLEAEQFPVRHVMNITDFEDKIDHRAAELGTTWRELARGEERAFWADMDSLGILRPHERPRASDFVARMTDVARRLDRTGRVRRKDGEWVYVPPERRPGENFPTGRELARHAVPEPRRPFPAASAGAREFMVWRPQDPPRTSFPGPWGRGIPGWHLECFAMAEELLGLPVDLHGGGRDLIFPHHYAENEVALALDRVPFARVFLHTAFVTQDGAKMAKSSGNLIPIRTAVGAVGPDALRWHLISRPYSERLEWRSEELARSGQEYERVRRAVTHALRPGAGGRLTAAAAWELEESIRRDLAINLGTDRALARLSTITALWEASPNGRVARGDRPKVRAALRSIESRLGLALL
ncbi:MAG TPA: class I tRNA ligase family protein [Thermoplasmata archaeon]|nr:class I tRNA ligase family protein [Thermoplasmata archaeon]